MLVVFHAVWQCLNSASHINVEKDHGLAMKI